MDVFWCIYHKIDLFEHNLFENDFLKSNLGSAMIESNEKMWVLKYPDQNLVSFNQNRAIFDRNQYSKMVIFEWKVKENRILVQNDHSKVNRYKNDWNLKNLKIGARFRFDNPDYSSIEKQNHEKSRELFLPLHELAKKTKLSW